MAYSYNVTVGDGIDAVVSVPFAYFDQSHVHVRVESEEIDDADLVWTSENTIVLPEPPMLGAVIRVYRVTPREELLAELAAGVFDHNDVNAALNQLLYMVQEALDTADDTAEAIAPIIDIATELEDLIADGQALLAALPSGGLVGQLLARAADSGFEWVDPDLVPSGGDVGQVLTRIGSSYEWADPQAATGGHVTLKQAGAVGDGVEDDTAVFASVWADHDYAVLTAGVYLVTEAMTLVPADKTLIVEPGAFVLGTGESPFVVPILGNFIAEAHHCFLGDDATFDFTGSVTRTIKAAWWGLDLTATVSADAALNKAFAAFRAMTADDIYEIPSVLTVYDPAILVLPEGRLLIDDTGVNATGLTAANCEVLAEGCVLVGRCEDKVVFDLSHSRDQIVKGLLVLADDPEARPSVGVLEAEGGGCLLERVKTRGEFVVAGQYNYASGDATYYKCAFENDFDDEDAAAAVMTGTNYAAVASAFVTVDTSWLPFENVAYPESIVVKRYDGHGVRMDAVRGVRMPEVRLGEFGDPGTAIYLVSQVGDPYSDDAEVADVEVGRVVGNVAKAVEFIGNGIVRGLRLREPVLDVGTGLIHFDAVTVTDPDAGIENLYVEGRFDAGPIFSGAEASVYGGTLRSTTKGADAGSEEIGLSGLTRFTGDVFCRRTASVSPPPAGMVRIISDEAIHSQSLNTGPLGGDRNLIDNGSCWVAQGGATTLTGSHQLGAVDRFYGRVTNVTAGTLTLGGGRWGAAPAKCGTSGASLRYNGVSTSAAALLEWRHRISAEDALRAKNRVMSFAMSMWHSFGSGVTVDVFIRKADAANDFSSTTAIASVTGVSVPDDTDSEVQLPGVDMGDCSNGLQILVRVNLPNAVTTQAAEFADIRLEYGALVTQFHKRQFYEEMARCQRFRCKTYPHDTPPAYGGTGFGNGSLFAYAAHTENVTLQWRFPVEMFSPPTVTVYGSGAAANKIVKSSVGDVDASATSIGTAGCSIDHSGSHSVGTLFNGHGVAVVGNGF